MAGFPQTSTLRITSASAPTFDRAAQRRAYFERHAALDFPPFAGCLAAAVLAGFSEMLGREVADPADLSCSDWDALRASLAASPPQSFLDHAERVRASRQAAQRMFHVKHEAP